jgi:polyisoprenoid-binding protein YceI
MMHTVRARWLSTVIVVAVGLIVGFSSARARPLQETKQIASSGFVLMLDPGQSAVHWSVDSSLHTVHGTFALTRGTVQFDPETGKANGEIVVAARSGQSGNGSRDARMHKEILETAKYPDAIFRATWVEGNVNRSGASDVTIHGILSIHGSDHDLTAKAHVEFSSDTWKGSCKFEVPYVEWGIKDPSRFVLKVKPVVNVEIETVGSLHEVK